MKTEVDLDQIIADMQLPFQVAPLQYYDAITAYREGRYALFYDVGGGKTLVSTLIAKLFDYPTVVMMPHILIRQWERHLKRVRVPDSQVYVYYGPKRDKEAMRNAKWILTSHAIFRKDAEIFRAVFRGRKVTLLTDEAQAIKDIRTKLFKAVSMFIGVDNPWIPMSATPTAKPEDTYAYMKLKTPQIYRSMTHWDSLHVAERDFFGGIKAYRNIDLLRDNFALKAAKRDKKDLFNYDDKLKPDLQPIPYELDKKHTALYKRLVDDLLLELPNGEKIDGTTSQRLRHMMQQIVWNPERFTGDDSIKASGFELLEQLCEEVDFMLPDPKLEVLQKKHRSKFVIWTYYQSTTEAIYRWMTERYGNTGVTAYGGSNSQKAVDAIMFDDNIRWMIANPLSVGAGLELQHVCWEMFFAEMVTTPIPNRQAFGRVDRPGQKFRPTIRFGQAIGTIQKSLFNDLLRNDERAVYIERSRSSIREDLLGLVEES